MPRTNSRAGAGRRGRPSVLSTLPTAALKQELERRQSKVHELAQQREALDAEIRDLSEVFGISATTSFQTVDVRRGAGRPKGSRQRLRNGQCLVASLQAVLQGKTMSVKDLEAAVKKSGYKTKSSNFRVIVNQALLAHPKAFKKVDRGTYAAR